MSESPHRFGVNWRQAGGEALRASPRLVAELRNLRNLAAYPLQYLEIVLNAADPLKLRIDGAGS